MSLAAILSATAPSSDRPGLPRAQLVFAAQTLIEYQAHQAFQAGASQIFVMIEAVTPFFSRMVDRFAEAGVEVHLIRDMTILVRQLPRESDVLLFADGAVIDQKYVAELGQATGNVLLLAEDDSTTAHMERVDAAYRWAGLARVSPTTLFNTLDLIGDWDVVLTLMRAVVQSNPKRVTITTSDISEGRVALVDRQEMADLVGKSLAKASWNHWVGAEHYLLQIPVRMLATPLLRMQVPALHIALAALGVAALGALAIVPGWTLLSLLLLLVALMVDMLSRQLAVMGQQASFGKSRLWLLPMMISLAVLALGWRHGRISDALYLGIITLVTVLLAERRGVSGPPRWAWMTSGSALVLLLLGAFVGQFSGAIILATLLGLLSLASMLLMRDNSRA